MDNNTVVEKFVSLIERCNAVHKLRDISDKDKEILFNIADAAGFKPIEIVSGSLTGYNRDQDGSALDRYVVNTHCPFVVITDKGNDWFATGWLDEVVSLVHRFKTTAENIEKVKEEVERSIPFQPVIISLDGDTLVEEELRPNQFGESTFLRDHIRDVTEFRVNGVLGEHLYCQGKMSVFGSTKDLNVLVCDRCCLRIQLPKEIGTYGDLR